MPSHSLSWTKTSHPLKEEQAQNGPKSEFFVTPPVTLGVLSLHTVYHGRTQIKYLCI
jgi:hypothetical protein